MKCTVLVLTDASYIWVHIYWPLYLLLCTSYRVYNSTRLGKSNNWKILYKEILCLHNWHPCHVGNWVITRDQKLLLNCFVSYFSYYNNKRPLMVMDWFVYFLWCQGSCKNAQYPMNTWYMYANSHNASPTTWPT